MKIGILTFPNSASYGAVLQMYALYHTIEKLGHDVEIINYYNEYLKADKHVNRANVKSDIKIRLKKQLRKMMHCRMFAEFTRFEKNHFNLYPHKCFSDKQKLKEIGNRYSTVVCGSDQIWNPNITDTDLSFFLDFCGRDTKRVSYAPSFGISKFTEEFGRKITPELEKFSALSVREEPGKVLIEKLVDRKVPMVVDPTFLVDSKEWTALEKKYKVDDGNYIFCYTILQSESIKHLCKSLSQKTGLKIVMTGGNWLKKFFANDDMFEYAVDTTPHEWLYLIHHARYVVTNSFHGTAFSINYRKDFYVEFSSLTNSRLEQIIKTLGLEDRVIRADAEIEPSCVDYTVTDKILPELCDDSMNYLDNALREDSKNG